MRTLFLSAGGVEDVVVQVVNSDTDLTGITAGLALGGATDAPSVWVPAGVQVAGSTATLTVRLSASVVDGDGYRWMWARIARGGQVVVRRVSETADFLVQ